MPPLRLLQNDDDLRERIRENVGYLARVRPFHVGRTPARPTILRPGARGGVAIAPPPEPIEPTGLPGGCVALMAVTASGVREIQVSPAFAGPLVIRHVSLSSSFTIGTTITCRLLYSQDNDTTAVAEPTGTDIIIPRGDSPAGTDRGINWAASIESIQLEPYIQVPPGTWYIKLKVHNLGAGANTITAVVSIDRLG